MEASVSNIDSPAETLAAATDIYLTHAGCCEALECETCQRLFRILRLAHVGFQKARTQLERKAHV